VLPGIAQRRVRWCVSVRRLLLAVVLLGLALTRAVPSSTLVAAPVKLFHAAGTSTNWSGYAVRGATFTHVRASWIEPTVTCPSGQVAASAFWVGIDGYTAASTTLQQIGTDADCNGLHEPAYYPWFEIVPASSEPLPVRDRVRPGDKLSAAVTGTGTTYTLALKDLTAGWNFTTQQNAPQALDSSAEWVAEAPSTCNRFSCRTLPLADFGKVSFTNAAATADARTQSISGFTDDSIVMVTQNGATEARPSALLAGGTAFGVSWSRA